MIAPLVRLRAAATLGLVGLAGCIHVRIDETFWLRSRPGAAADSAAFAAGLSRLAITKISITAADGVDLVGVTATRPDAVVTVIYFGADNFLIADQGPATIAALTNAAPVNVVLVDYRGYGTSGGRPTLATVKADALTVYDWVSARRDLAPAGVLVHGHSIGSFVAATVAAARPVRGLVLQGSGTTPKDWMRYFMRPARFKWWARAVYPFLRFSLDSALTGLDNSARLREYRGPLLVLTGSADDKADPAMSDALLVGSASPDSLKRLVVLRGSGHEDMLDNPAFPCAYQKFVRLVAGEVRATESPNGRCLSESGGR